MVQCGVQKVRGQGAPSVGPYVGGILQIMLLGYTTLASVKERSDYSTVKRRRGRPRKEEAHASSHSTNQRRRSRIRDPDDISSTAGRRGSGVEDRSKRSQRQIKRTRCYSPSSEGTREVFLPRKRSRDGNS